MATSLERQAGAFRIKTGSICQYHLYVTGKIQRGIDRAATKGTLSRDEVERKFNCIGRDIQTPIAQLERGEGMRMKQALGMIRRGFEEGAEDE